MMNTTNYSRYATVEENALASADHAASPVNGSLPQVKAAGVNVSEIKFMIELLAQNAGIDSEPREYLERLMCLAHHLLYILEAEEENIGWVHGGDEVRLYPPHLPPLPSLGSLMRLSRVEQERILDKRASELLREIEGLRRTLWETKDGYYKAPPYRTEENMIRQARRRFSRLRERAMTLGHWTDGRWDAGKEETHLV
jgi:hypothetical protein